MPFEIVRNDITKMEVDAVVNAANKTLLGGGGVDGAIHRAAGKELLSECKKLGGCETGDAKITGGYKLLAKYVIHTVGPVWHGGNRGEEKLLRSCYRRSLEIAKENGCTSVAFPLISSGIYGYPKAEALRVAVEEISAFLFENDMTVYIVIFDKPSLIISEKLFSDIKEYIDDRYAEQRQDEVSRRSAMLTEANKPSFFIRKKKEKTEEELCGGEALTCAQMPAPQCASISLETLLSDLDESFSEMLLRKIDEKGMTDAQCYKKANIDRKLFSKIRSDKGYRPKKATAVAFAIALELSLEETREMLSKAGFSLSHSNKFDIIIEYFIAGKNYNIYEINEALFAFDQVLLGV